MPQLAVTNSDLNQPFAMWQEIDVTFPAVANTDCVISHNLQVHNPEQVEYIPTRKAQAADVYHDTSSSRKAWQQSYVVLRCSVANAKVRLLLYVPHAGQTFSF